jgi:polyribonucleotide nucleotidyltransferase
MYPQYTDTYKKVIKVGDKDVTIEIGKFSEQVSAAVLVSCGETVVHTTVALGRKVNLGYFPLSVEFVEKLYSAGIIKGSRWVKRDGRPSDDVILKARVIDRSLRPLFPSGVTHEVQIINTVFSFDGENDPDMLGLLGSALGVMISEIPFEGPLSGLRVGYSKETQKFSINPTLTERESEDLDLVVSGHGDSIVMVEAGANEVSEDVMVEALVLAQNTLGDVTDQLQEVVAEVGKEKVDLIGDEAREHQKMIEELAAQIQGEFADQVRDIVVKKAHLEKDDSLEKLIEAALEFVNQGKAEDEMIEEGDVKTAVDYLLKKDARRMVLEENTRPDGRTTDQIRDIWCEVDVFPRTHGSAMFKRGATQAVTIVTLNNPSLGQLVEGIQGEETRYYMHHYNMPPYASGEAGRFGFPKRREIGHGSLAERALRPMLPSQEEFPYAILAVSEILSSNGSTSQASVCGSTMSLMAAGVPIKRPVAGIAMGLMSDGEKFIVLSDIQGLEDHVGDMDFKVAGTEEGITAIQMDIKLTGLKREILEEALAQAKIGRMHILGKMLGAISEPRTGLSEYAPKIEQVTIPGDQIGELIGPGGKMIKSIIEKTGADVNVEEDEEKKVGNVWISSSDQEKIDAAVTMIENLFHEVKEGEEFDGPVTRIEDYGAFVEFLPGREGLVHVSRMSTEFTSDPRTLVNLGDQVHVRVSEIKDDGKIGLSMLSAEEEQQAKEQSRSNSKGRPDFRGGRQRSNGGRDRRGGSRNGGRRDGGDRRQGGSRDNSGRTRRRDDR